MSEAVVARIDERTKSIQTELVQFRIDLKSSLETVADKIREVDRRYGDEIEGVKQQFQDLNKKIDNELVHQTEFAWIQKFVYGFVSLIVVTVVTALLATVITPRLLNSEKSAAATFEKSVAPK